MRAGMSQGEAIGAATLRPAEFFEFEKEMGSIDVGKKADLLLLDRDPPLAGYCITVVLFLRALGYQEGALEGEYCLVVLIEHAIPAIDNAEPGA